MLHRGLYALSAIGSRLPFELKEYYWKALTIWSNPWLWALFALILILERVIPADPTQRLFSKGVGQDFLWFNLDIAIGVALLPAVAGTLKFLYDRVTGGYVLSVAEGWPTLARIVLAVVITDFLYYCKHRLSHRVGALWHFHAVHHSQRELNALTDRRQHIVEHLVTQMLIFLPLIAMGLKPLALMAAGAALWWQTLFVHGNIRTNFGPVGWVIVSPQFHRIHHSIELQHYDKNFGSIFTIWDRLFGTIYHGVNEYPPTGVHNVYFRPPNSFKPQAWLADFGRQVLYPFRQLLKSK
ncbi:MAG: sterol desaturase family protein [Gemmatimonadaceae bacterium]